MGRDRSAIYFLGGGGDSVLSYQGSWCNTTLYHCSRYPFHKKACMYVAVVLCVCICACLLDISAYSTLENSCIIIQPSQLIMSD